MSEMIGWMAAEAERPPDSHTEWREQRRSKDDEKEFIARLPKHQFAERTVSESQSSHSPAKDEGRVGHPEVDEKPAENVVSEAIEDEPEVQRERRIYRGRTVAMLRRYMRYSIETGRMPSILGREFFRAKVTSYTVTTFEDRVIFVHDMERCLEQLDEFSQQILARHILQEHDQLETAGLLGCSERTVRSYVPMALDLLSEILLEVGLLERAVSIREKACQGGNSGPFSASDCEEGKNKF